MKRSTFKPYVALCFALLFSGCAQLSPSDPQSNSTQPDSAQEEVTPQAEAANRVQIDDQAWVALPQPADLGYQLTASQLLTVSYQDSQQQQQTNQLPIQLQVTQDKVVLAGFSSWGTRLLSLQYQNQKLDTYVMAGLANTLPKPEQVLFNLMITLWPLEVWQPRLDALGWQLTETKQPEGKQRLLINAQGQVVADIEYANIAPLKGDIRFINRALDFTILIKTLQYQTTPVQNSL